MIYFELKKLVLQTGNIP